MALPAPYVAYDWTSIAAGEPAPLRGAPSAAQQATSQLEPGTSVQVTGIGWDEAEGQWWYYVETNTAANGWVLPEMLLARPDARLAAIV
ncbi:MAG: hypothetical protein V3R81_12860 [Gammaproteobacteria bacterium]